MIKSYTCESVFKILFILLINICNVTAIAFTTTVWVLTKCFQGEFALKVMCCLTLTLLKAFIIVFIGADV